MNSRRLDDNNLTLAASGWTYDLTFVLYDRETFSMWLPVPDIQGGHHFMGISGEHAGRELAVMTSVKTAWSTWVADYPGSKLMR